MKRGLLVLGSSLGDRSSHLRRALAGLARLPRTRLLRRSRVYETAPVGTAKNPFLNMAVEIRTGLSPMGLLVELKRLEAKAGRKPGPRWSDRPLDIDIAAYGRLRLRTRWLTIPHPRMRRRAFALAPLADLNRSYKPLLRGKIRIVRG